MYGFSEPADPRQLGHPQLYMAGLEIDNGTIAKQGAAIYLWNQPRAESNHTPAWDTFGIPPVN